MLTLKKVKEMVKAPAHTKRVPSPKVLLEEGRIFLRKEFEHGSHLTLYHNGYVWFSAGKRNTVFHIHDCRGDYAYGASKGKGEVIKEEYFENCEWHIRALFEGEQRVEESQLKCEGVGQTKVSVSYHAVAEDWGEMADSEINVLDSQRFPQVVSAYVPVWIHRGPRLRVYAPCPVAGRGRAHGPAVCERLPHHAGYGKKALQTAPYGSRCGVPSTAV